MNGVQCYGTDATTNYISGGYTYQFLNESREEVFVDTLYINIAFNDFNTVIKVSTKGGQQAVDYWYSYYSKKEFILEIKEAQFIDEGQLHDLPGNQDIEGNCVITYMSRGDIYWIQTVAKGSGLQLPKAPEKYYDSSSVYTFLYWENSNHVKYTGGEMIKSDLTLTAVFEKKSLWNRL